jgi:hypothetical protein
MLTASVMQIDFAFQHAVLGIQLLFLAAERLSEQDLS